MNLATQNTRSWKSPLLQTVLGMLLVSVSVVHLYGDDAYVAVEGSDLNRGTEASPYRTLRKALESAGAGDTITIRGGVYDEAVHSSSQIVPSGTSFASAVTIRGYPGEEVVLRPSEGVNVITLNGPVQYTVWENLTLDGELNEYSLDGGIYLGSGASHNRFVTIEIKNMSRHGILTAGEGTVFNEFVDLNVHHNGSRDNLDHGIYIATSDNLIDGGEYHDNFAYGVHLYNDPAHGVDRNVVRNVRIFDNRKGMALGSGDGNYAYNNLVYDNLESGVSIGYGATNAKFYHNTVVGTLRDYAVTVLQASIDADVRNNIFWGNSANAVRDLGRGTLVGMNVDADPAFVNEAERSFRLSERSPAVDAGVAVPEVTADIDGVPRPQGAGVDVGAYEYRSPGQAR